MDKGHVEINGVTYKVQVARSEEERTQGLQGVTELAPDEGMLFVFDPPQAVSFWMKDTDLPLDIIYIDDYEEVTNVFEGQPQSPEMFDGDGVKYVLEVNQGSGIEIGDEAEVSGVETAEQKALDSVELPPDNPELQAEGGEMKESKMVVLGPKGKPQMELKGGERIFSRPNTKTLIRLSKRAYKSKEDKDYKALGKRAFKYLEVQDNKEEDFVDLPGSSK